MAYNNNYNGNRNSGYKNNNRNFYQNRNNGYNNRPQNNRPAFNGFDATQYKKPDIEIKDLNGRIYRISGNFSTAFSAEILKTINKIEEIHKGSNDLDKFPEMFALLKDWCLSLINLNTEGVTYTMDDVNAGFNDIYVLYNLVAYIAKVLSADKAQNMTANRPANNEPLVTNITGA